MILSSILSSCILETCSDGDSTTSLGSLFPVIVLTVKNFFHISESMGLLFVFDV